MANYLPKNRALDEEALHRYLFEQTNRHQELLVHQLELAEALGVTKTTICFTLKRMVTDGRLRLVRKSKGGQNTYYIVNPEGEDAPPKAAAVNESPKVMWQ